MRTATGARSSTQWDVWGTYAFLAVSDPSLLGDARALTEALLDDVGVACSRFREDSWLNEVNRHPGSWVPVDPLLAEAVAAALDAAEATGGLVDPCLGRTMVTLGYDRDLAELTERPGSAGRDEPPAALFGAWREVRVTDDAVRIPSGVALDLGATGKAWAADLVADTLVRALGCDVVVSLGGDLRVLGPDPSAPVEWPVRVAEHPGEVADGELVRVTGGLATSSTRLRRWSTPAGDRHHLVDPRTGLPAREVFRTVTASGATCVAANTASTAALVLGADAPDWLRDHGVSARLVAVDGRVTTVGDWPSAEERHR